MGKSQVSDVMMSNSQLAPEVRCLSSQSEALLGNCEERLAYMYFCHVVLWGWLTDLAWRPRNPGVFFGFSLCVKYVFLSETCAYEQAVFFRFLPSPVTIFTLGTVLRIGMCE